MKGIIPAPAINRLIPEWNIMGAQQGIGRMTADFFHIPTQKGRTTWLPKRFKETCSWFNARLRPEWFSPGLDGAISTARFELLCEGLQECEARIFLERALLSDTSRPRMGKALATKAQDILDERTRRAMWVFDCKSMIDYNSGGTLMPNASVDINSYAGSGWQDRAAELFSVAAEVQRAMEK